jgi:hypothetical protein
MSYGASSTSYDLDLQAYPIKWHLPTGEVDYIDRDGVVRRRASNIRRSGPPDWPPPWPDLRVHVEPADVLLVPARASRSPFPTDPTVVKPG